MNFFANGQEDRNEEPITMVRKTGCNDQLTKIRKTGTMNQLRWIGRQESIVKENEILRVRSDALEGGEGVRGLMGIQPL